jgi:RHS repeat-associated protein
LCFAIIPLGAAQSNDRVFSAPGGFQSVNSVANLGQGALVSISPDEFSGALNISMTSLMPTGKGKAMPDVAFSYNSHRANGPVGVGWQLSVGAITRNTRKGLNFGKNDFVLTLLGTAMELTDIGGGKYKETIERSRLGATKLDGPGSASSWVVVDIVGTKYYFGTTDNSRQRVAIGAGAGIYQWYLDKIEDLNGNYSTMQYQHDGGQGYLTQVAFTGNDFSHLDPTNVMTVSYESRPVQEVYDDFRIDGLVKNSLRVKRLDVVARGAAYASYELKYRQSRTTGRSVLSGITKSNGALALPTIAFSYSDEVKRASWGTFETPGLSRSFGTLANQCLLGDFDGDGRMDVACYSGASGLWNIGLSKGSDSLDAAKSGQVFLGLLSSQWGGGSPVFHTIGISEQTNFLQYTVHQSPDVSGACLVGDFNGDGRSDIACYDSANAVWQVSKSTGHGFLTGPWPNGPSMPSGPNAFPLSNHCVSGDFNRDGKTDLACYIGFDGAYDGATGKWSVALSTGTHWKTTIWSGAAGPPAGANPVTKAPYAVSDSCAVGDFNGDGQADIMCYDAARAMWTVSLSDGSHFITGTWSNGPTLSTAGSQNDFTPHLLRSQCVLGDFNGDGKTDLACYLGSDAAYGWSSGKWSVALSMGTKWETTIWTGAAGIDLDPHLKNSIADRCITGDFDGDGKTDIACKITAGGDPSHIMAVWSQSLSRGQSFSTSPFYININTMFDEDTSGSCVTGDFNGDGKTDLLCNRADVKFGDPTSGYDMFLSDFGGTDLLTSVTGSNGGRSDFTYGSSTEEHNTRLGFPIYVLKSATASDGRRGLSTTSYKYSGGSYLKAEHEFRGFNDVETAYPKSAINGSQLHREIWFHQGDDSAIGNNDPTAPLGITAGKPYRDLLSNGVGTILSDTSFQYKYDGTTFAPLWKELTVYGAPAHNVKAIREYTYDSQGNVASIDTTDASGTTPGRHLRLTYSDDLSVHALAYPISVELRDDGGSTLTSTHYGYDETINTSTSPRPKSWNVTSVSRRINDTVLGPTRISSTRFTRSASGNVLSIIDPSNATMTISYDSGDEFPVAVVNAVGQKAFASYFNIDSPVAVGGLTGQPHTVTDVTGATTTYGYDLLGRPRVVIFPDLSMLSYSYYSTGDPNSQAIRIDSTAGIHKSTYLDGMGRIYHTVYSAPGNNESASDVTYDTTGRLLAAAGPYQQIPTAGGGPVGMPRVLFHYDELGRPILVIYSDGRTTKYCYDGLVATKLTPEGRRQRSVFDIFGDRTTVELYAGQFTSCTDEEFPPLSSTDKQVFSSAGVTAPASTKPYTTMGFQYDASGRLVSTTRGESLISSLSYDGLGNVTKVTNADRGTLTRAFDSNGRLVHVEESGNHASVDYKRDPLGRVTQTTWKGPQKRASGKESFIYDLGQHGAGRLTTVSEPGRKTTYVYDISGNVLSVVKEIKRRTFVFTMQYDSLNRMTRLTYPDGRMVTYQYDGPALTAIADQSHNYVRESRFNQFSQPEQLTYGNGVVASHRYSLNGATTDLAAGGFAKQCAEGLTAFLCLTTISTPTHDILSLGYSYDGDTNVVAIDDSVAGKWTYLYDSFGRLIEEGAPNASYAESTYLADMGYDARARVGVRNVQGGPSYQYDEFDRRLYSSDGGHYKYARDRVHARPGIPSAIGSTNIEVDANGNWSAVGTQRFRYDAKNQLIRTSRSQSGLLSWVQGAHKASVDYSYDWAGRQVERVAATSFVFGIPLRKDRWLFVSPLLMCHRKACHDMILDSSNVIAESVGQHVLYFHYDRLGSLRAITDDNGKVTSSFRYSSFGVVKGSSMSETPVFTGHKWDDTAGLYYYGKRFYEPAAGQFISPDFHLGADTGVSNAYAYANNNPLRFVDPDGAEGQDGGNVSGGFGTGGWGGYGSDHSWASGLGGYGSGGGLSFGSSGGGVGFSSFGGGSLGTSSGLGGFQEVRSSGWQAGGAPAGDVNMAFQNDGIERSYLDPISIVIGGASFYGARALLGVLGATGLATSAGAGSDLAFPDVAINTGHALPHMIEKGLTDVTLQIESEIDRDVTAQWSKDLIKSNTSVFDINVDGIPIRYHANSMSEDLIRVGTYYVPNSPPIP